MDEEPTGGTKRARVDRQNSLCRKSLRHQVRHRASVPVLAPTRSRSAAVRLSLMPPIIAETSTNTDLRYALSKEAERWRRNTLAVTFRRATQTFAKLRIRKHTRRMRLAVYAHKRGNPLERTCSAMSRSRFRSRMKNLESRSQSCHSDVSL
jgi:hypothetical protein